MDDLVERIFCHVSQILTSELKNFQTWEQEDVINKIIFNLETFKKSLLDNKELQPEEEACNQDNLNEKLNLCNEENIILQTSNSENLTGDLNLPSILKVQVVKPDGKPANTFQTDSKDPAAYNVIASSNTLQECTELKQSDVIKKDCSLFNVEGDGVVVYMQEQSLEENLQYEEDSSLGDQSNADISSQCSTVPLHLNSGHIDWCLYYTKEGAHYTCKVCHKIYRSLSQVKTHLRGCHELGEKTFTCSHTNCSYSTRSASKFRAHKSWHANNAALKCPVCDKEYLGGTKGLRNHMKIHSKQREFRCKLCSKLFINLSRLNYHIQNVHGDPSYLCESCDRQFRSKANFMRHQRTHTSEKPFLCPYCSFNTGSSTSLTSHVRSVHKEHDFTTGKSDKLRKKVERSGTIPLQKTVHMQNVINNEYGIAGAVEETDVANFPPLLEQRQLEEIAMETSSAVQSSSGDRDAGNEEHEPVITLRNQEGQLVKAVVKVKRNDDDAVLHVVMES